MASAWGVESLPATVGRDADAIVAAVTAGALGGLVVGGVDPDDTADPAAFRAALDAATFVVSLEQRETDVTRGADVVLPVAPVVNKAGTFVTWDGRARAFDTVLADPMSLPDLRILAGIAEEMGRPLGWRTVEEVRAELAELGAWDGDRPTRVTAGASEQPAGTGGLRLATWRQMVDLGTLQQGEVHYLATARPAVARLGADDAATLGLVEGDLVTVTGDRGSLTLPLEVTDVAPGAVWVPMRSTGRGVLAELASPGSTVVVKGVQ